MRRASNESHFVEFFCGQALLTKAFRDIGCRTRSFDVNRLLAPGLFSALSLSLSLSLLSLSLSLSLFHVLCLSPLPFDVPGSPLHDLSGAIGLLTGILTVWESQTGSLIHLGCVCSSFCWVNAATHQRSSSMPLGTQLPHVKLGNTLASRTVFLCLLAHLRGSIFTVEQPRLSKLQEHPHFQYMMRFLLQRGVTLRRHEILLGEYGAESRKPIWLYAPLDMNIPSGISHASTADASTAATYYSCHAGNWIYAPAPHAADA